MKHSYALHAALFAALLLASCSAGFLTQDAALEAAGPKEASIGDGTRPILPPYDPESEEVLRRASNYGYVILKTDMAFDAGLLADLGAERIETFELDGFRYSLIRRDREVLSLLARLRREEGVLYAEPDWRLELDPAVAYSDDLDDPWIAKGQYAYRLTGLGEALVEHGVGPNEVYVAVIDSGINATHEEFSGVWDHGYSMWSKSGTIGNVNYAYVGTGFAPVDMLGPDNWDSNEDEGHGTHVAGTIAALGDNGLGVAGVAPDNVKLITYKCFANDSSGSDLPSSGSSWAVYGSLKHLVDWKVTNAVAQTIPVNMSLGGSKANYFAIDMIDFGLENGVVVIAASGNEGQELAQFPAAYQGVIAVGATDGRDELAAFSNRGRHVSVSAPGVDIVSTGNWADTVYQPMSGTSMATPFVTGLVALMLTHDATLTPAELKFLLEDNAKDLGPAGFDRSFGWGRVDVSATLDAVIAGEASGTPYSDFSLIATLENLNPGYDNGLGTDAIIGQPVYLYDSAGDFVSVSLSDDTGRAAFKLLRAGTYAIATDYYGLELAAGGTARQSLAFSGSMDATVAFEFNAPIYHFQTLENDGNGYYSAFGDQIADTVLSLYDAAGTLLVRYDQGQLDSISWACASGTYYLAVEPWYDTLNERAWGGNYTVIVSSAVAADDLGAAGAALFGAALNQFDLYEPNGIRAGATLISLDTRYRNFLSDGDTYSDADATIPTPTGVDLIDWFRVVIP